MPHLRPPATLLPGPLHERTNSHEVLKSPQPFVSQTPSSPKVVRRTDSLRHIRITSGSDSLPEDDSIYNAEPVSSGEFTPEKETGDWLLPAALLPPPTPASSEAPLTSLQLALSPPLRSKSPPRGHSNWPTPLLNTILERQSTRSLRGSASAPRLRTSPERLPMVVETKNSVRSIKPVHSKPKSPWPRDVSLAATNLHHKRSFSMNDLHCAETACWRISSTYSPECSELSRALLETNLQLEYPFKPVYAPPVKSPTPPGLPSFRTREAQELRLLERPKARRLRFLPHWLRHEAHETNELTTGTEQVSEGVASPPSDDQPPSQSVDLLKRVFGLSRIVRVPESPSDAQPRASLPHGIVVAHSPGVLAVADDGTQVRGRFGMRASSHGIGSRSLQNHPFARPHGHSAIEEVVRQIDKACSESNQGSNRNHLTQLPQFPSIAQELSMHSNLSDLNSTLRQVAETRPSSGFGNFSVRSPPIPPANTCVSSPLRSPVRSFSFTRRAMDSDPPASPLASSAYRMREPGTYPPASPASRSRAGRASQDGVDGVHSFIEERGRSQAQQRLQDREEIPDCWSVCWHELRRQFIPKNTRATE